MTDSITMEKAEVLQLYPQLTEVGKGILEKRFGKDFFSQKITDRVKTIKDVLDIARPTGEILTILNYSGTDRKMIGVKNFALAELIAEVLNEGKTIDMSKRGQQAWFPVFDRDTDLGFSSSLYDDWISYADAGSRLAFVNEALSDYAGRTFTDVYREIILK